MHQVLAVQEGQCLERRRQHLARLLGSQRARAEQLGEGLVGVLHHDEQILLSGKLAQSRVEQRQQVGMGPGGSGSPMTQLQVRQHRRGSDDLDRRRRNTACPRLGREHGTAVRPVQHAQQRIDAIDQRARFRPALSHRLASGLNTHDHAAPPIPPMKIPPGGTTLATRIWRFASQFDVPVPVPSRGVRAVRRCRPQCAARDAAASTRAITAATCGSRAQRWTVGHEARGSHGQPCAFLPTGASPKRGERTVPP